MRPSWLLTLMKFPVTDERFESGHTYIYTRPIVALDILRRFQTFGASERLRSRMTPYGFHVDMTAPASRSQAPSRWLEPWIKAICPPIAFRHLVRSRRYEKALLASQGCVELCTVLRSSWSFASLETESGSQQAGSGDGEARDAANQTLQVCSTWPDVFAFCCARA